MNLENTIKEASQKLKNYKISSYELDAQIILADIVGVKREFLLANSGKSISEKMMKKYDIAIKRRTNSEPVAYIIGKKEFWSQDFVVDSSTLVPRPETELLLYKVVKHFKDKKINILDIGTGCGCILLSILKELKLARGIGIDISSKAVEIAKINSKKLGLIDRSEFKVFDLNKFNIGKYDLIVSNPPYIPSKEIKNLSSDIKNYEPKKALDGGRDGLDQIKKVIYISKYLLLKNGILALEIGYGQYSKAKDLLSCAGFKEIGKEYDFEQNVRCIISTKASYF